MSTEISEYNQSMFLKSSSRVKWNGKISKPIKNRCGIMQGGVLSPKLFNEFLQDLGKYINPPALKGLAQAKFSKKSMILFWLLNMTI